MILRVKAGYGTVPAASLLAVSLIATFSKAALIFIICTNLFIRVWTDDRIEDALLIRRFVRPIRLVAVIFTIFVVVV